MSPIQETLFDMLLNALTQIALFAVVAAAFSRLIARLRAKYQCFFYQLVLLFCLTLPVMNTFWKSPATVAEQELQPQSSSHSRVRDQEFWDWRDDSQLSKQFTIAPAIQTWTLGIWGVLVLLQVVRFSRAVHRVYRLRRDTSVISPVRIGMASQIIEAKRQIALLESTAIDDPVTVGVLHPAILLPSRVLSELGQLEFSAILAHEYGHILRRDFSVHMLCKLISLPVAWHPGIGYLMSKISQTRELACDEYAAARLGQRRLYARTLLRLASLCLNAPRANIVGLGIFDGDNLETRILTLTNKRISLSRAALIGSALTMSVIFTGGEVLAQATSLQASADQTSAADKLAGTWHWMFNGKSFATMILVRGGAGLTGTVTGSQIALNDNGELSQADPSDDSTPKPIGKATLEGSSLRVVVSDGNEPFEFIVTLKDATHAEIRPKGAPPNMKPIPAEKTH